MAVTYRNLCPGPRWLAGLTLLLIASSCTSSTNVIFDDSEVAPVVEDAPSTTQPPAVAETTASSQTTIAATSAPSSAITEPPAVDAVDVVRLPGNLLINVARSTIAVLGTDMTPLIVISESDALLIQPNWSPDGQRVAWGRGPQTGTGSVVVVSIGDGSTTEYITPYVPFYVSWRDDGDAIALLGAVQGATGTETGLTTVHLDTGVVNWHYASASFYLDWSPDGRSMINHLSGVSLEVYELQARSSVPIASPTGRFHAAEWMPDGSSVIYVRPSTAESVGGFGPGGLLAATQSLPVDELVRHDLATDTVEILGQAPGIVAFSIAPNGSRVGYTSVGDADGSFIHLIDLDTRETESFASGAVEVWQWSPDSEKILLMGVDRVTQTISYRVWNDGEIVAYSTSTPTVVFFNRYLFYWGQYDRSHSLWAPDSSAFTFAAVDGDTDYVFVQRLDESLPGRVAPGSVATFSPVES